MKKKHCSSEQKDEQKTKRAGQASEPSAERATGEYRPRPGQEARAHASVADSRSGAASSGGRKSPRHESRGHEPKRRGGLASESPASVADPRAKRRGGHPGNQNAYKHGFYSHLFRERERRILDEQPLTDLSAEIELLHVATARFLESMQASNRTADFESNITALRLVNLSAQSIAALLRVQALTGSFRREAEEVLQELGSIDADPDAPPPQKS